MMRYRLSRSEPFWRWLADPLAPSTLPPRPALVWSPPEMPVPPLAEQEADIAKELGDLAGLV